MDGWENYDRNWKSWVDDLKNYWHDGSGLHDLTMSGHCYFGSMRNSGDFSNQDCTFVCKDYCWALKRPYSLVQKIVAELGTLNTQTHDSWLDSKYSPKLKMVWAELVD